MQNFIRKYFGLQLLIVVIITLVLGIPIYILYNNTREIVIAEAEKQAVSVAVSIAKFIEKDPEKYIALSVIEEYLPGSYDEAYYQDMLTLFQSIKTDIHADYVFTEKKISDTEIVYILDGEDPGSENFSPIGSTDTLAEAESRAFDPGIPVSSGLIHDPVWGDYLTGFSPIRNPKTGQVIGVVGVDFSSTYILTVLQNIRILLIFFYLFLVIIVSIVINKLQAMREKTLNTDFLTGMFSKRYLASYLSTAIHESRKTNTVFCLMMMDIDNFKACNDLYGHLTGDKVLMSVSEIIRSTTRRADSCFRYGGDEFIIVLPEANIRQAIQVGERIQQNLLSTPLPVDPKDTITITLSIGIVEWNRSLMVDRLIELADQAMYKSKEEGRNRITTYSGSTNRATE